MFLPSLANIAKDFQTDYSLISLAVAGYLAATAIIQVIIGPLSDRLGRRPVLLGALLIFTFASFVCAIAPDIWTFLVFRMLQGSVIAGYALSLAIVRDTTSERRAAGLIGYISMAMALAPMLGPMLGGILDAAFGWRANFIFYCTSGAVLLALCWFDLGETNIFSATDKEDSTLTSFTLLSEPRFWGYSLCTSFSTGAFYIFLTGAPLVAKTTFGVSTATLGFYIGSITGGFMLGGFIAGKSAPKYPLTTTMLAGRIVACGGLLIGISSLLFGYLTPLTYFGSTIFVGLGNGITMPSSNAGAMSVHQKLAGSAAGLNGALTVAGGALLTSITGLLLTERNSALLLLGLMFAASFAGLISAVWAMQLERNTM